MKNLANLFLFLAITISALSGCAEVNRRDPSSGKTGVINQIYSRHNLLNQAPSCLYAMTAEQIAAGTYVQIKLRRVDGVKYFPALVSPSLQVRIGDEVEFSSDQCSRDSVPMVTQVIRHN
jgi:uncharacterized protein YceK